MKKNLIVLTLIAMFGFLTSGIAEEDKKMSGIVNLTNPPAENVLNFGDNIRAYQFRRNEKWVTILRTVKGEEPISLSVTKSPVCLEKTDGTTKLLNAWEKTVSLVLSTSSVCLVTETPELALVNQIQVVSPCPVKSYPGEKTKFVVQLHNVSPADFDGKIEFATSPDKVDIIPPSKAISLKANGKIESEFIISVSPQIAYSTYTVGAEIRDNTGKFVNAIETVLDIEPPTKISLLPNRKSDSDPYMLSLVIENKSTYSLTGVISIKVLRTGVTIEPAEMKIDNIPVTQKQEWELTVKGESLDSAVIFPIKTVLKLDNGASLEQNWQCSFASAKRTKIQPVIDGDLSEWVSVKPILIDKPEMVILGKEVWKGAADLSGKIYCMWDEERFYIAAEIVDHKIVSNIPPDGRVFLGDGIEVYFDTDYIGDCGQEKYNSDDHQYGFFNSLGGPLVWSWSQLKRQSNESKIAYVQTDKLGPNKNLLGYIIEGSILFKELNLTLEPGKIIGFNVGINDDNTPSTFVQERQMMWSGEKDSWKNPSVFSILTFVE